MRWSVRTGNDPTNLRRRAGERGHESIGHIPEALEAQPNVKTQCPDPNDPVPGTCTIHAPSVDVSILPAGMAGSPNPPSHFAVRGDPNGPATVLNVGSSGNVSVTVILIGGELELVALLEDNRCLVLQLCAAIGSHGS